MKLTKIAKQAVTILIVGLLGACMGIPDPDGGSKSSKKAEHVTANAVGSSVTPLFAPLQSTGLAALKASSSYSDESSYPLCDIEDASEEGVTFSNEIPSGHYGLKGNGVDVEDGTTCDATGFTYWTLDDITGEDCAGDEMTIVSGSGVAGFASGSDGEEVLVILGTFKVEGQEVTCNIFLTESYFEAECEMDGKALETDSCDSSDDESDWEDDSSDDSDGSYDEDDDSSYEEEGTEDHSSHW